MTVMPARSTRRRPSRRRLSLGALALALLLAGATACSATDAPDGPRVLASFYPLEFVAERVGGDDVVVSSITPPGAEPHDLELSPAQVRAVGAADVVVVLSGFQPAVDEAVAARSPERLVDVATQADLDTADDPHFWLDPTLLAAVVDPVAEALADALPESAEAFATRAATLREDLAALDAELAAGLATCESRTIVTAHEAFGFLAARYDLEQIGIAGIDPEAEPSPARLRQVAAAIEGRGVTTIFTETLLNPKVAEVLATDLGLSTAVLDPLESLADPQEDYLSVMRENLAALRPALRCV